MILCKWCLLVYVFFLKVFVSFGAWQSYQTGIHHKSTPSPELRQLLAAQCDGEAGEQSARHQVEQGRLAHLHHSQRHKGDEQTDAVRYHEREGQKTREALLTMQISSIYWYMNVWSKRKITLIKHWLFLNCCLTLWNTNKWDNCPYMLTLKQQYFACKNPHNISPSIPIVQATK